MSLVDSLLRTLDFSPRGGDRSEADAWGEIIVSDHKDYRTPRSDGICEQSKMSLSNPAQPIHNYIKALMAVAATAELGVDFGVGGGSSAARCTRSIRRCVWTSSSCALR
ncbi:hypothetical protein M8494_11350 [Serratia ureilytica]